MIKAEMHSSSSVGEGMALKEEGRVTIKKGDEIVRRCKVSEFAYLSYISALQKELFHTRSLVNDWRELHEAEDNELVSVFVDPTVNLEIKVLRQKLFEKDQLLKKAKEEALLHNFAYQRSLGQKLANKCRTLTEENADFGKTLAENHLQPLSIVVLNLRRHINVLKSELKHLRELNMDMDADNDLLTQQLADMTRNYAAVCEQRDKLQTELQTVQDELNVFKLDQEAPAPRSMPQERKESRSPPSKTGESVSSKELRRIRSDKGRYMEKNREKERDSRKIRDRSREKDRERRHHDSYREKSRMNRRKEKNRSDKDS